MKSDSVDTRIVRSQQYRRPGGRAWCVKPDILDISFHCFLTYAANTLCIHVQEVAAKFPSFLKLTETEWQPFRYTVEVYLTLYCALLYSCYKRQSGLCSRRRKRDRMTNVGSSDGAAVEKKLSDLSNAFR
jgi:hypothetical protein